VLEQQTAWEEFFGPRRRRHRTASAPVHG